MLNPRNVVMFTHSERKQKVIYIQQTEFMVKWIYYWKIIKEVKTSENHHNISLDIFMEHFEKLALGNESGDACECCTELKYGAAENVTYMKDSSLDL